MLGTVWNRHIQTREVVKGVKRQEGTPEKEGLQK